MITITAKQLRDRMGEIVRRVQGGEEIRVTYREKPAFKITPDGRKTKPTYLKGLAALDAAPRKGYVYDPDKSYKKLYHEMLEEKYGDGR